MAKEHPGQWLRYTAGFAALAVAVIVGLGLARQDAFSFVVPLSEYVWEVLVVGPRMLHAFGLTHVESIRYVGETPVSLALVALPWVGGFLLALPIIAVARDLRPARRRVPWWDVLLIVQLAVSAFSASVMPVWGVSVPSLWRGWYFVNAAASSAFGLHLAARAGFLWRPGRRLLALVVGGAVWRLCRSSNFGLV
jgi:hypothetical protein